MTNIANACEFYEQSEDVENPDCETYCSGWRDLDQQYNLPAKVWDLDIHLQDGDGFVGDYTPSHFNSNQGSARISYTDISVLTDYAACMAACDAIEPFIEELESRQNENMTMSVNDYQEDESVKGNFSIDLDGGYNADGHFSASYCNFRSWRW